MLCYVLLCLCVCVVMCVLPVLFCCCVCLVLCLSYVCAVVVVLFGVFVDAVPSMFIFNVHVVLLCVSAVLLVVWMLYYYCM